MRRILLAAVLVAVAAPASAETVIWTGEVHVEKWVTDDGSEFYGYWRGIFGNMPGVRQFEFAGRTYTVDLFYITNTPRSLLAGAERRGSPGILPTDRGLAWLVDGQRFELADHDRSFPDRGVAVWDDSGLDWQDGQVVSCRRRHRFRRCRSPAPACSPSYCSSGDGDVASRSGPVGRRSRWIPAGAGFRRSDDAQPR